MSLEELSKQRIVSYESFVEFLKREFNYPVNEDIAKEVYNEYVNERKIRESSFSIFDHHRYVLQKYKMNYGFKLILSELRKLKE